MKTSKSVAAAESNRKSSRGMRGMHAGSPRWGGTTLLHNDMKNYMPKQACRAVLEQHHVVHLLTLPTTALTTLAPTVWCGTGRP